MYGKRALLSSLPGPRALMRRPSVALIDIAVWSSRAAVRLVI
jgi:hypothetical protein